MLAGSEWKKGAPHFKDRVIRGHRLDVSIGKINCTLWMSPSAWQISDISRRGRTLENSQPYFFESASHRSLQKLERNGRLVATGCRKLDLIYEDFVIGTPGNAIALRLRCTHS